MRQIDNYIKKINSALQGAGAIRVSSFVDEHRRAEPLLHPEAKSARPDMSALIYGLLRLPPEILNAEHVVMGQSDRVFSRAGMHVGRAGWKDTAAVARRRKCKYNAKQTTLAVFVASVSDVEDLVTILTALYIELLKMHDAMTVKKKEFEKYFSESNLKKLKEILGDRFTLFEKLAEKPIDWELKLLAGSLVEYAKAVQEWWINIAGSRKQFSFNVYTQPVYFISSNSHSFMNILSGFPYKEKKTVLARNAERLKSNEAQFKAEQVSAENICYYLSRFTERQDAEYKKKKLEWENKHGLIRMKPFHDIDIEAQIYSIRDVMNNPALDKRLGIGTAERAKLRQSNALIINIAYPLGLSAYHILKEVSENVDEIRGVYIMGKAASLNAGVGDITIPTTVLDTHTGNNIFLRNTCTVDSFAPYFPKSSIFANQKAVTVRGTFLQNEESLNENFNKGYSIVEMEAGPYAVRLFEMQNPERFPNNETFVLNPPFNLGVAYYVSDTPHNQGVNLGSKRLTWEGLNATYGISLGMMKHIFESELKLLK